MQIQMHRSRHFSQGGEDGAVAFLLARLGNRVRLSRFFVEFGAWDGIHLSNTYALAKLHHFSGLYIEGDAERFKQLQGNFADHKNIGCVNKYVEIDGRNSLQNLFDEYKVPIDFDFLSIDIDGNDYQVWRSLIDHKPKIVVIEMNIRVKPGIFEVNDPESAFEWGISGSSISSLCALASNKGYALISCVGCNAIYIRCDLLLHLRLAPINEYHSFTYEGHRLSELTFSEKIKKIAYRCVRGQLIVKKITSLEDKKS